MHDPQTADWTAEPILVVDDEPLTREVIGTQLQRLGYRATGAADMDEAVRLLRSQPFSMVLTDYEMPGGSGLDLLRFISEAHPALPVILLTGRDSAPLASSAIASGALDFLTKPFRLEQLARMIDQNRARVRRDQDRIARLTSEILAGTVRALVRAIDAKDPHTATHSEGVTRLALRLGEAIQLPGERLRVLEMAALLHDVGKIGIPESVLRKPGPLTEDEWRLLRNHPVRSAEIVREVTPLAEVAAVVRHHHERIDGRGYPDGLEGEAIPQLSRLICIADAYEAMTSDRAYRAALAPGAARASLRAGCGTQFDARLTARFLELHDL